MFLLTLIHLPPKTHLYHYKVEFYGFHRQERWSYQPNKNVHYTRPQQMHPQLTLYSLFRAAKVEAIASVVI